MRYKEYILKDYDLDNIYDAKKIINDINDRMKNNTTFVISLCGWPYTNPDHRFYVRMVNISFDFDDWQNKIVFTIKDKNGMKVNILSGKSKSRMKIFYKED